MSTAVWLPYAIQGGEALLVGLAAFGTTYAATHDWHAAVAALGAAIVGKVMPAQVVGTKP
jgi:hypothetical protein